MGNLLIEQRKLVGLKEEHSKSSSRITTFLSLHLLNQMLLSVGNAYHNCFYGDVLGKEGQNEILNIDMKNLNDIHFELNDDLYFNDSTLIETPMILNFNESIENSRSYFEIRDIKNFLSNDSIEVQEILDSIKTSKETSIVIESLIGTEHITMLEKGHGTLKKYKQNKNKKGYVPYTYETALRKNRHMLESYLKEIGVGQQRAQKISQILAFL